MSLSQNSGLRRKKDWPDGHAQARDMTMRKNQGFLLMRQGAKVVAEFASWVNNALMQEQACAPYARLPQLGMPRACRQRRSRRW